MGGGTASGKSSIAESLIQELGSQNAMFLNLDSYYFDRSPLTPRERGVINYDHPSSIDFKSLARDVGELAQGRAVTIPIYDFIAHSRTGYVTILPRPLIIVEGIFALTRVELRREFDLSVFVEVDSDIRFARRLQRDISDRGSQLTAVIAHYFDYCRPMHLKYVEPSKSYADLVISNQTDVRLAVGHLKEAVLAAAAGYLVEKCDEAV